MSHRFFIKPNQVADGLITITGSDVQHILKVLRLKEGATLHLADGTGLEYKGFIIEKAKDFVKLAITEQYYKSNESPVEITLLQGLPKGDKMELIIQKCTELGVKKFIPVACQRSVVRLSPDKAKHNRYAGKKSAKKLLSRVKEA